MILDEILEAKREELLRTKRRVSLGDMKKRALDTEEPRSFKSAITADGINIIAEVKKASPSKGVIREDFDPLGIAVAYEENGAAAISVLTEKNYFMGELAFLTMIKREVTVPVLRKDFLFDEYQLHEARAAGADAVLLIAASLEESKLSDLMAIATELSLAALVEVHTEDELSVALGAGADIIGINNRNLKTFVTDIATTIKLSHMIPKGKTIVSESGINTREDIDALAGSGASAFLIGESLVREHHPGVKLKELLA